MTTQLDAAIDTLTARLTKGAGMLWDWEQQGQKDTPEYPVYRKALELFHALLAEYESKCEERARQAVPVQPSLMDTAP